MIAWFKRYLTNRQQRYASRKFYAAMMEYPNIESAIFDVESWIVNQLDHQKQQEMLDFLNQFMFNKQHQKWENR